MRLAGALDPPVASVAETEALHCTADPAQRPVRAGGIGRRERLVLPRGGAPGDRDAHRSARGSVDDTLAVLRSHAFTSSAHLADVARAVAERKLNLTGR